MLYQASSNADYINLCETISSSLKVLWTIVTINVKTKCITGILHKYLTGKKGVHHGLQLRVEKRKGGPCSSCVSSLAEGNPCSTYLCAQ